MIKIENTEVFGFEAAIRGARNPMNSWARSDSGFETTVSGEKVYHLGENDKDLMTRLVKAGNEHRKFMRQIVIWTDITAPLYWWKEYDTYKVGTVANSCSTMHKLTYKPFERDDFSHDHLSETGLEALDALIVTLNKLRDRYLENKDKQDWWDMIQLLPSSYNQRRTVSLNYENALSIYRQRRGHKLDEWHVFRHWVEGLPCAEELITEG
ncbi:MAG: hypothetical protein J6D53_03150 [Blautia sp.]|nr:hypothetical protein [Blautia sp.]